MKKLAIVSILILMMVPLFAQTSASITDVNATVQADIGAALAVEAGAWGMPIIPEHNVYATRDDMFVAVAAQPGIENLQPTDFESGPVEIGLAYISAPPQAALTEGYYRLEIEKTPGVDDGTAILSDQYRTVSYTYPIRILPRSWPWPYPWPWMYTICFGYYLWWWPPYNVWYIWIDFHWIWWDVAVVIPYQY